MRTTYTSDVPRFGENCPNPDELQTGDLLFPRRLTLPPRKWFDFGALATRNVQELTRDLNSKDVDSHYKKISDALDSLRKTPQPDGAGGFQLNTSNDSVNSRLAQMSIDQKRLLKWSRLSEDALALGKFKANPYNLERSALKDISGVGGDTGGFSGDPLIKKSEAEIEFWMWRIFEKALPDLTEVWLKRDLQEFKESSEWRLLRSLLLSADVRLSFFIGHVGVVIREEELLYVVEANMTDYSSYGVASHLYYVRDEAEKFQKKIFTDMADHEIEMENRAANLRGWVNRRVAVGDLVWKARPQELTDEEKEKLSSHAKEYSRSRKYGFFESAEFGDDNRLYCAELVYRLFQKTGLNCVTQIDKTRIWGEMETLLGETGEGTTASALTALRESANPKIPADHPFFVLPPALLWRSMDTTRRFIPSMAGENGYDV